MMMQSFQPQTATVAVTPTAATQNVAIPAVSGAPPTVIRVRNASTQDVFLNFGSTNAVTAVVPTPGTNQSAFPVPAGAVEVFTIPNNATFLAYIQAVAGAGNLYFTGGEGV